MNDMTARALSWTEAGMVPDSIIRGGIRRLLERKRRDINADDPEAAATLTNAFVDMMNASPVALVPELANEQHYEVPAAFFDAVLGEHVEQVGGRAGGVAEHDAGLLEREHARDVDAVDEVVGEALDAFDEDAGVDRPLLRCRGRGGEEAADESRDRGCDRSQSEA